MSARVWANAGLILAMLAAWLAAPAVDWRVVPWGLAGVEQDFMLAVAELIAALAIAAWAIARLPTAAPRDFFAILIATAAAFLFLEWLYWHLPGEAFHDFARQWDGVKAAPVALLLAIPPLIRLPVANTWPGRSHIRYSRYVLGAGAVASLALTVLHPSRMLDAMAFALLVTAFVTAAAISLGALPLLGKPRDPD